MVASFMDKAVTKSYVRLPGSGSDKGAGVSFCDLSRGSNLAASIPVPQHVGMPRCQTAKQESSTVTSTTHLHGYILAASIPVPRHVGMPRCQTSKQASSTVTSTNQKRARSEDDSTESNKRRHIDSTNQNVSRTPIDLTIKPVPVTAGPVTVSPQEMDSNITSAINIKNNELIKANTKTTKLVTFSNTEYDVTKLHEENSQLRSENAILQKQVSLFKQLFRNPQRLESVLQCLNERALIKPVLAT